MTEILFNDLIPFSVIFLFALWGGAVRYVAEIRQLNSEFSYKELVSQLFVSGFTGMLCSYLIYSFETGFYASLAGAGFGGFIGVVGLNSIIESLKNKYFGANKYD